MHHKLGNVGLILTWGTREGWVGDEAETSRGLALDPRRNCQYAFTMCAKHCAKYFTNISSCSPHNHPEK